MAMRGLKATVLGAVLGLAAFIVSGQGAMAQSSNAAVMNAYGVSASKTLTPDQISAKLTAILNQAGSGGGTAGVAAFVAALTATAGASAKGGDGTATSIVKALALAATNNPSLSGAIAGGMTAGTASLAKAGYAVPVSFQAVTSGVVATATVTGNAIVQTAVITVVQPSPQQTCSGGSCN